LLRICAAFTTVPDLTPYSAEMPQQSLVEMNPAPKSVNGKERAAALASARMDFTHPDAAPLDKLGRILWHSIRGWDKPYPVVQYAAFLPGDAGDGKDDDDDDKWKAVGRNMHP
jgi:hypothetical protein